MSARFPGDPNELFRKLTDVNAYVARLRSEGWTVALAVPDGGDRVYVQVSTSRSCDPPSAEDLE